MPAKMHPWGRLKLPTLHQSTKRPHKRKTGCVEALDRIPDTIFALLLPHPALEPAQITSSMREAGWLKRGSFRHLC
ncbi:MAG: hypothetical protein GY798_32020 [Hyphomicrobiales bacterium]|nr:hypothetical protein [Hyphomicrobiales bacterium]